VRKDEKKVSFKTKAGKKPKETSASAS